jgi:putative membrane protein
MANGAFVPAYHISAYLTPSSIFNNMPFTLAISKERVPLKKNFWLLGCILIFILVWADSLIGTTDLANWLIENMLTFIFVGFFLITYRRFHFSDLTYLLICVYLCLHVYGSKYTYAENPFGFWLQNILHLERNHYDRIVHFAFGFLLAYPMREFFLKWLKYPRWVSWLLPIEITLSVGAFYEIIEWAVADLFFKSHGDSYLGTQGDIWDAQKDIFLAFCGAILATSIVSSVKKVFNIYEEP